jgi:hypothetical protein
VSEGVAAAVPTSSPDLTVKRLFFGLLSSLSE